MSQEKSSTSSLNSSLESFDGHKPICGEEVFIHKTAAVIGQVVLGDRVNIWPQVTLRADEGQIKIGEDTNIQDGTTVHMTGGYSETMIGSRVTVGHMCLLHGCIVGDDCLIGMGSMLLDNCEIGAGSYIAAGTMITGGKKIPPNSFVMGRPGSLVIKPIPQARELEKAYSWRHYVELATKYLNLSLLCLLLSSVSTLVACQSLSRPQDSQPHHVLIQKKHVTISTLKYTQGVDYTPFARTEYDPFSHQREVIALTQSEPITINYTSFSAPQLDQLIQKAFSLYGQFRFSRNAVKRFRSEVLKTYGEELFTWNIDQLQAQFNESKLEEQLARHIVNGAKATRLAIAAQRTLVERASLVKSQLNSWKSDFQQDLQLYPQLAQHELAILKEVKRAQSVVNEIMKGSPILSKEMKELSAVAAAIR